MNITNEIKDVLIDKYRVIVDNNQEIQFYYNQTIECYQFKDSRFSNNACVWNNENYRTREQLIQGFKKHINSL